MSSDEDNAHDSLVAEIRKINSSDQKKFKRAQVKNVRVTRESELPSYKLGNILSKIGGGTNLKKKLQPLIEPLDKPKAKRLQREAGYERVAIEANKWDGIVEERKKADQLHFPLEKIDLRVITSERNYKPSMKTDLEKEVYGLLQGANLESTTKEETEEEKAIKKAMSLKEIRERSRKIMMDRNLKMRLERKAALLNKSKSRKYHKILRRERVKRKKEEFEHLKATDPEAALEILDKLENTRVKERMDLRHKKSNWLRLQQSRAPHDDQIRDMLKENAEMRHELLEKLKFEVDDDNEDAHESDENDQENENNQGIKDLQNSWDVDSKPDESFHKIRQYWENINQQKLRELEALKVVKEYEEKQRENEGEENEENGEQLKSKTKLKKKKTNLVKKSCNENKQSHSERKSNEQVKKKKDKEEKKVKKIKTAGNESEVITTKKETKIATEKKKKKSSVNEDLKNHSKKLAKENNKTKEENTMKESKSKGMSINKNEYQSIGVANENIETKEEAKNGIRNVKESEPTEKKEDTAIIFHHKYEECRKMGSAKIDNSFLKRKLNGDESGSEEDEGFEDILSSNDDYVKEFVEEKKAHEEEMKPKAIDNFKAGWGNWGGPGIVHSEERKRKFKIKAPKAPPNKYANIGNVIYNESGDMHPNLRKNMVNELPFPFTTVKDFESSIRQPIGRTFVPEVSHKKLISPAVVQKMGAVIEPMDEECLIKKHEEYKNKESALEKELDKKLRSLHPYKKIKSEEKGKRKSNKKKNKNRVKARPLIFV